jgi:pimeloyl-ACP methyl ester carboxylesterase
MQIGVTGVQVAREVGEIMRAGMLSPWGCTAPGHRALRWLLGPRGEPAATPCLTPVVLVHGYGGSRANWLPLEVELRRAGFVNVHTASFTPMARSLRDIAEALRTICQEAMEAAGSDHLHLVGHSLGGVVVRLAVQRLGLAADVLTAVTVAAPHRGTPLASLGCSPIARALRPGSPMLVDLDRCADGGDVQWVTYFSERDLIVGPASARLDDPGLHAVNVRVPDAGHLGILRAPVFLRSVPRFLLATERSAATHDPAPGRTAASIPSAA